MSDSPTRMPPLRTERLIIRPFAMDDLATIYRILDVEDAEVEGREPPRIDFRRAWLEWNIANEKMLASMTQPPYGDRTVVLHESGEVIGVCGLVPSLTIPSRFPALRRAKSAHDEAMLPEVGLFWHVARAHRGHGYATEAGRALIDYAFSAMNLARIIATTEYDNLASQAVMRHLGMIVERNPRPDPPWLQVVATLDNPLFSRP